MSSHAPADDFRSPRRGLRIGWIAVLLLLAFVVGGTLASYAMWKGMIFGHGATSTAPDRANQAASGFVPAQPLTSTGAAPTADTATLVTRETALAAQLAALEARTATVSTDAAAAGAQATRAESLLVAVAVRRAIDRGAGLGYLEEQLRTRFAAAQPTAVAVVIQAARAPVTIEDLREGLEAIGPDLQTATDGDWLAGLRRELSGLVVLRREGTVTTSPNDRLARAARLLDDGRVDAARAEVAQLPGSGAAGGWMAAARRYLHAHQALDMIETAAVLGQAQGPQPPLRAAPPVVVQTAPVPVVEAPVGNEL
jgi:hypothetical protein